jgi:hypothetical protein
MVTNGITGGLGGIETLRVSIRYFYYNSNYLSGSLSDPSGNLQLYNESNFFRP